LLEVSTQHDMTSPFVKTQLPENVNSFRLPAAPNTAYYWRLTPLNGDREIQEKQSTGSFHTGWPEIVDTDDDRLRYKNPRVGSHWGGVPKEKFVQFDNTEPLAPWFDRKSFLDARPPRFEEVKSSLPVPALESDTALIDMYWYCWKTLFDLWLFPPTEPDHQAVANLLGARTWAGWGSTMVWDSAFMLHFARYAYSAHPFITALDNCYARQHENLP
jgi:hypothetical protein